MRGALLNPFQGINPSSGDEVLLPVSLAEFTFWMWRVSGVSISVSGTLSAKADLPLVGEVKSTATSMNAGLAGTAHFPFLPAIQKTEFDQVFRRHGYTTTEHPNFDEVYASSPDAPFDPTGKNEGWLFSMQFGWSTVVVPGTPIQCYLGFNVALSLIVQEFFEDPGTGIYESAGASYGFGVPNNANFNGSGSIILRGEDPITGAIFEHNIPGNFSVSGEYTGASYPDEGSAGATSATASILIEASSFYPWKDRNGVALYNSTGVLI